MFGGNESRARFLVGVALSVEFLSSFPTYWHPGERRMQGLAAWNAETPLSLCHVREALEF